MHKLIHVELLRAFTLALRYPANFISNLFINTVMFYGLFKGAQYLSGQQVFGTRLDAMIVGYSAWVLVTKGVNKTPLNIQTEADTGVLESVFLSSYRMDLLFLVRAFAESFLDVMTVVLIVALLVAFTGSSVHVNWLVILPTATLVVAANGIGMLMGGIALQVKRVSAILPSIQLLMLGLMFTPFESLTSSLGQQLAPFAMALPMVPSVVMLRQLMVYQQFDPQMAGVVLANGLGYVALGMIVFNTMTRRVKAKGLLGGY
jgi:ABC-2 type transport system permease protein